MINCLIVDDAPVARAILEQYCQLLPALRVCGSCSDAFQARSMLGRQTIDLLLVDIDLPLLSGIDLVKTLKHPPQVIFTTAYKEFATDAFDLGACDYLLKPFSLERFIIAIDRALERMGKQLVDERSNPDASQPQTGQKDHLFVKSEGMIRRIDFGTVLFLEASRNKTKVVTAQQSLQGMSPESFLSPTPLSSIEKFLPSEFFSRVHRSFIVNRSRITGLQGNRIHVGKSLIPLGESYRTGFFELLGLKPPSAN